MYCSFDNCSLRRCDKAKMNNTIMPATAKASTKDSTNNHMK